jgi:F-type H+-transporting ATPase subunit b
MLIDWFTVGAQLVNFIILVWLMKRFLYQPVLDAIDARETRIADELAQAAATQAQAESERDAFRLKNQTFDAAHAQSLQAAQAEVAAESGRLQGLAREAADAQAARQLQTLRNDARDLSGELASRVQAEVFAIARRALQDLASSSLETRLCDVFLRRLQQLDEPTRAALATALSTSPTTVLLRTAFDLPTTQREALTAAVHEAFSTDVALRFETAPTLVSGIELSAHGQKLAWSIADYLDALQRGVDELLESAEKPSEPASADAEPTPS